MSLRMVAMVQNFTIFIRRYMLYIVMIYRFESVYVD
jgi:hypothetical protein